MNILKTYDICDQNNHILLHKFARKKTQICTSLQDVGVGKMKNKCFAKIIGSKEQLTWRDFPVITDNQIFS